MTVFDLRGESTVSSVLFKNGKLCFQFIDGESDEEYAIEVLTSFVYCRPAPARAGTVYIEIKTLSDYLPIDNESQRYMLPAEFKEQMTAVRKAFHLVVGQKATEYPLMLQIVDGGIYLACPISSIDSVEVTALIDAP